MLAVICALPVACKAKDTLTVTNDEATTGQTTDTDLVETETFAITTSVENGYTSETAEGKTVYTFTVAGEYLLTGNLTGRIVFADTLTESCTVNLSNCNITSSGSAICWNADSKKIIICAVDGTTNTLTTTASDTLTNNTIASENNIEIKGTGRLDIVANQKHAVDGSEITVSENVEINIEAEKDGLHAKAVTISVGTINVSDADDAIQAEVNKKGNKGTLSITGGTLNASGCNTAIKADTSVTVTEGATVNVTQCTTAIECVSVSISDNTVTVDGVKYEELA